MDCRAFPLCPKFILRFGGSRSLRGQTELGAATAHAAPTFEKA